MSSTKLNLLGPWPPPYGGVSIHMQQIVDNLKRLYSFQIFYYSHSQAQRISDLSLIRIYVKSFLWPYSLYQFRRYIHSNTIIHNHSIINAYPKTFVINTFLNFINKNKIILIDSVHDQTLLNRFGKFPSKNKRTLVDYWKQAKVIIAGSEALKNFVVSLGINKNKVCSINPLLPFRTTIKSAPVIDAFLNTHTLILSTIGAYHPLYDLGTIIRAFCKFRKRYPNSGLIILKCGFAELPKYSYYLKQLLKENKCENDILILKDIPHEQVLYILSHSDIFVRGVKKESFGLSKIESIMMGTPVLCVNTGEIRFMNVYRYGDKDDLFNKIIYVLNHRNNNQIQEAQTFYKRMAQENLSKIIDIYNSFL